MDYKNFDTLLVRCDRGVVFASIANPPMNLADLTMLDDLDRLGRAVEADPQARVLVFDSADPDIFVAHIDLDVINRTRPETCPPKGTVMGYVHQVVDRFRTMPKATIGKLDGIARGFGSEFLLSLDMRFAAIGKAVLGQPEAGFGICPGGSATQRLPRLLGRARALEILLGCADFPAELAERYGYVNRALPADELGPFVDALAYRIASFSPAAIRAIKHAVNAEELPVIQGLIEEEHCLNQSLFTPRAEHGLTAALLYGLQDRAREIADFQGIMSRTVDDFRRTGLED